MCRTTPETLLSNKRKKKQPILSHTVESVQRKEGEKKRGQD